MSLRFLNRLRLLFSDPDEALDDHELGHVPRSERKPVYSLIPVWLGFLSAPDIILAATTVALVSTFEVYVAGLFVGLVLVSGVATIMGIVGQRTGLSTYMLYRRFFGYYGAKLPVSILLITRIGWNAVETIVAAKAMLLVWSFIGMEPNVLATILAVVLAFTAFFGYDGLDFVSRFTIPALVVTFGAAGYAIVANGGIAEIMAFTPTAGDRMPFTAIVSLVFAIWVSGTSLSADIVRYARSDRDVVVANYGSIVPSQLFMFVLAGAVGLVTGYANPALGIAELLGGVGAVALFLAAWTTVDNQYYSAGLAASELTNRHKAPLLVGIVAVTALLSFADITSVITQWLVLIGVAVPPLVGVVFADYFLLGTRFPEIEEQSIQSVEEAVNPAAIIAWLAGAGVAQFTPLVFMPPLLGLLSASLVYVGVRKLSAVADLPLYRAPDGSSTARFAPTDD
ncbi:purine-cytosine permease family protein [Haloarcula onubensis]|uniref:Cytosine permease n=1 Tax=Haloarcula onubensis TaxID=2950539 RepID=A0ABU2FPR6_9EURY|nr:cytosine permease [Halomicroarcula sp. S3CR25-11]MDS0282753.1 cytosine permease [Halomicroarcula sp. S3CR25-11]